MHSEHERTLFLLFVFLLEKAVAVQKQQAANNTE